MDEVIREKFERNDQDHRGMINTLTNIDTGLRKVQTTMAGISEVVPRIEKGLDRLDSQARSQEVQTTKLTVRQKVIWGGLGLGTTAGIVTLGKLLAGCIG